jgi:hypothetical protein
MSNNDSKNYLELKQKYEEVSSRLHSLHSEKEVLSKKVGESNGLYKLEFANLRTEYEAVQGELTVKLKEAERRLLASEGQVSDLERDLKATLKELSELKTELISAQEDFECQKNDREARGAEEVMALSAKASKFELMYKDEVEQRRLLIEKAEKKLKEMNEKIVLLNEVCIIFTIVKFWSLSPLFRAISMIISTTITTLIATITIFYGNYNHFYKHFNLCDHFSNNINHFYKN